MTAITLSCPSVNSGTAIDIYNSKVIYGWKNLTRITPVPQKYDIAEADISGWENPLITIEGSFDVDDLDTNEIRHAHLINLAKVQYASSSSTSIITLTIPTGNGATQTNLLAADASTTTIRVVILDFNINIDASAEQGHIWNFSIRLQETA